MSDVDAIALEATYQIENAFAVKRGKGGYVQRRAAVQVIVANAIRALSPPEPTERQVAASALADRIERWMNDAAMYAEGQIFDLCPEDQPTVIAALRAMPLQQRTLTREQIKTAVTKAACRKYGTTNPPCPVPSCECYKEGERAADAVLALLAEDQTSEVK